MAACALRIFNIQCSMLYNTQLPLWWHMAHHRSKVPVEEDALKNLCPVLNKHGVTYSSSTGRSNLCQFCLASSTRRVCEEAPNLVKYFRSLAQLNYSALCPSNGLKPYVFIQNQIPLWAKSTPHFKAKSNTKKLFIWNHSKSSGMLLSRFHWRL